MNIDKQYTTRNITIGDIAKELGLSKTTVSRAISGKGRVGAVTKQRVHEYIQIHNYKPNIVAKGLAQSKTYNIATVLPIDAGIHEIPFFQSCLRGICEAAASMEYDVIVTTVKDDDITLLKRLIDNQKVDGIILTRSVMNDVAVAYLKDIGIPFVLIGSNEDETIVQVDNDHISGCSELTSILIHSGYERIAFLAGNQNHIVNRNRYEGFAKSFNQADKILDQSMVYLDMNNKMLIHTAINSIMSKGVDCIVCSDDVICSNVLYKLEESGYLIPKDVRVASFYNNVNLENHNPPITALSINVKELGSVAGINLIKMISGEDINKSTVVGHEILLKRSTN